MARMAQALGFSVVAKGVETAQEEELVRTQRIALVQGHHYSQAVALEDVADLVQGQSSVFSGFTSLSI
jgi:EAL domain-containing protein (putative c-di-GMP-specific phosphodiesterase class I)